MSNFAETIIAKSDQLNADDLMAGPITVKITAVKVDIKSDQPVSVHYEGDNNKPWKPSKSMRRALILKWGSDENKFIGRSITLFRDPTVTWAGQAVGGVIISHMSDIDNEDRFLLTSSRGQKKPLKIERLVVEKKKNPQDKAQEWADNASATIDACVSQEELTSWRKSEDKSFTAMLKYPEISDKLDKEYNKKLEQLGE